MDWDWKEFVWDPAELELSSGGVGEEEVTDGALKGLRLEDTDVQESRSMVAKVNDPKASKIVSAPSGSTKRTRAQTESQSIACLVDGCSSDLGNSRDYHRRHRVCEQHSKAPIVILEGKQQRFCQQCSRFHGLGEFDEVKRSCRKRLDGHNRRRRKPKPPSLFMSGERFLPIYEGLGPRILQFNNPQICASATPTVRSFWPAIVKNEAKSETNDQQKLWYAMEQQGPPSYFTNKNGGRSTQFSLMHAYGALAAPGVSLSTKLPHVSVGIGKRSQSYYDGTTRAIDSSRALYLLSSESASTSELSLMRSAISPPTESPNSELHFEAAEKQPSSLGPKNNTVLIQNADDTNNIIYTGMRRIETVESGDLLTLPIYWE